MAFKPGQSGNPKGRKPGTAKLQKFRDLVGDAGIKKAVTALVQALDDDDGRVRVAAAKEICNRAFGTPVAAEIERDTSEAEFTINYNELPPGEKLPVYHTSETQEVH